MDKHITEGTNVIALAKEIHDLLQACERSGSTQVITEYTYSAIRLQGTVNGATFDERYTRDKDADNLLFDLLTETVGAFPRLAGPGVAIPERRR